MCKSKARRSSTAAARTQRRRSSRRSSIASDSSEETDCARRHPTAVTFSAKSHVYVTSSRWDFTPEEQLATWITMDDVRSVKKDNVRTIAVIRTAKAHLAQDPQRPPSSSLGQEEEKEEAQEQDANIGDSEKFCLRGLEHMRHAESYRDRIAARKRAVRTVLDRQAELRLLRLGTIPSVHILAEASRTVMAPHRKMAAQIGAFDASEAYGYGRTGPQSSFSSGETGGASSHRRIHATTAERWASSEDGEIGATRRLPSVVSATRRRRRHSVDGELAEALDRSVATSSGMAAIKNKEVGTFVTGHVPSSYQKRLSFDDFVMCSQEDARATQRAQSIGLA